MSSKSILGICSMCGIERRMHRDHIVPRALGGSDDPDNIQLLCANCHEDKTAEDNRLISNLPEYLEANRQAQLGHTRNIGRKHTKETRARMSASKAGNQNALGHSHGQTDEIKAKISAGMKAVWERRRALSGGVLEIYPRIPLEDALCL